MKHPPPRRYSRFVIFGATSVGCKWENILFVYHVLSRSSLYSFNGCVRMVSIGLSAIKLYIQL